MGAGVITLREGLEASPIVAIVLSFLDRTGRRDGFRAVWAGTLAALGVSAAGAAVLLSVGSELEGREEALWEAGTMLGAAGLLTWMVFWMRRRARGLRRELELKTERALGEGSLLALMGVSFVGVLREGLETALFLAGTVGGSGALLPAASGVLGLALALAIALFFYRGSAKLDLGRFFTATSVLLLLFAGWLLAHGLQELEGAAVLPESRGLLVAAFAVFAAPALSAFLWPGGRKS